MKQLRTKGIPKLFPFLILFFTTQIGQAQQKQYSTYEYNTEVLLQDSIQRTTLKTLERALHKTQSFVTKNETDYTAALVYHNLTDWSNAEFVDKVNFQHDALNRDFSAVDETNTKLMSAGIDFTYRIADIQNHPELEWEDWHNCKIKDTDFELHIWVIDLPDTIGSYSSWPEGNQLIDGIVIDPAYFADGEYSEYNHGKTLSTLVAMHFGLKPLLGSHPCADDGVRDTPRYEFDISCSDFGVSRCGGEDFMPDNLMSPTNDDCRSYFTVGQVHRMKFFLTHTNSLSRKLR